MIISVAKGEGHGSPYLHRVKYQSHKPINTVKIYWSSK